MYLTHGFFESQKVNVSSHIPKSVPCGVCIRRDYVLWIACGGTHVPCHERAITSESKPEPLLSLFSFLLFFFVKADFLGKNLRILKEWSLLSYAYPERFPTKRKQKLKKEKGLTCIYSRYVLWSSAFWTSLRNTRRLRATLKTTFTSIYWPSRSCSYLHKSLLRELTGP